MARGTRLHSMCEDFVTGKIQSVPHEIQKIGPLLLSLQVAGAKAEEVWMLDRDWMPTDDQDKAWVKAIIDVHHVADGILHVKDYKSGQMYPDHLNQLELYGLIGLAKYPDVKRVDTSAVYIDVGYENNESTILPSMSIKLIDKWHTDAERMMVDEVYEPVPSPQNCRWCPYAKFKGGPCEY